MAFLVTGGAGFIGKHTINELKHVYPDETIICLDNLSTGSLDGLPKGVQFVQGDCNDYQLVRDLVSQSTDGVIHLAADSRVLPSLKSPELARISLQNNLLSTLNVLGAILETNPNVPLVYAGSSTAYGDQPSPQREDVLHSIQSAYSAGKLAGELMIRSFVITFGLKATVYRYFQVYGPGQPSIGNYALVTGIFLRQFKDAEPLTIEGDGKQSRDFVHVADVAKANVKGLKVNSNGKPVNVGTGKSHTIQELADMISENQIYLPPRKIDLPATQADITKLIEILGWRPEITLEQGIADMLKS